MIKVKFRVFETRKCVKNKKCGLVHPHPTYRELYHIVRDYENEEHAIQKAWRDQVALLEGEGSSFRPLFQYVIPMRKKNDD